MTSDGRICEYCYAPDFDEMRILEIERGTQVLDSEGNVVTLIEIQEVETLYLPMGTELVGPAYDFTPSGISFDRPILITMDYLVSDLPGDLLSVTMAYLSSELVWEPIETQSSQLAELGSLTGTANHFTIFAILAQVPSFEVSDLSITTSRAEVWSFLTFAVRVGEQAEVSVDVTNNGGHEASHVIGLQVNGEMVASQEVTLSPGQSERVFFALPNNGSGDYEVVVGDLSGEFSSYLWINWWLIIGILAVIVLLGSFAVWRYRRREG